MPIRAELRSLYPAHWRKLSRRVRFERAAGRCQGCGRPHLAQLRCLPDGCWFDETAATWRDRRGRLARWPDLVEATGLRATRVVLAAAHLDSNPANNRLANLRALCQRCHMLHDRPHHLAQRWITYRRRYALGDLFLGRYEPALWERREAMDKKPANTFITARKGFCYLTIKSFGRNHEMMRIRAYKIDPDEKRHMRRLHVDVAFDRKKITQQLAEKREACRRYRMRSRKPTRRNASYDGDPVFGVYESSTRTIYTSGIPSSAAGVGRLLDAVLQFDRGQGMAPSPSQPVRRPTKPALTLVHDRKPIKP